MEEKAAHRTTLIRRGGVVLLLVTASLAANWLLLQGNARQHAVRSSSSICSSNNHDGLCTQNATGNIRIFIGVVSASGSEQARNTIRETWGADVAEDARARLMFFVLRPAAVDAFKKLRQEATTKDDMVIVSERFDSLRNITYSTLEIFKAATRIGGFTHVVKTEDDVYVRLPLLFSTLAAMPQDRLYAGAPMVPTRLHRGRAIRHSTAVAPAGTNSTNITTITTTTSAAAHSSGVDDDVVPFKEWRGNKAVRYGSGWGYVLSMDIASEIAYGAAHMVMPASNLLRVEEMATALFVDHVAHEQRFKVNYRTYKIGGGECQDDLVFFHLSTSQQQQQQEQQQDVVMRCMHKWHGKCCPPGFEDGDSRPIEGWQQQLRVVRPQRWNSYIP